MTPLEHAQRYFDAWNRHDASAISACFTPHGTYSDPSAGTLPGAAAGDYADALFAAFPDLRFDVKWIEVTGERVVAEWAMCGNNHGSLAGAPPTGQPIDLPGIDIITVERDGISAVKGFFDQRTFVDQLGMQVIVQPHAAGPFTFGRSVRVQSGNRATPGALSMTWVDVRSAEEDEVVVEDSRKIAVEMLGMPGFIGWVGVVIGPRLYTFTAWENAEAAQQLHREGTHRSAVKRVFSSDFAAAFHTGVWSAEHLNPLRVRCSACGQLVDSDCSERVCGCGAALPEPPPYL
jgi:steroid delta-isomerase-like uncharacterized protein